MAAYSSHDSQDEPRTARTGRVRGTHGDVRHRTEHHHHPALRMTTSATPSVSGHRLGAADAVATLVVYGTYECLHCRRAWPALRALASDGTVAVEWRHFAPPGAFPNAPVAAAAAEAAAQQGGFWRMHEALLVARTPIWPESVRLLAETLDLDVLRFVRDLDAPETMARVVALQAQGSAAGVRGTPSVRLEIGGAPVGGWLDVHDTDALRAEVRSLTSAHQG